MKKFHVIVIGAGFTGIATAHDLAMRGLSVTLVERGALVSGTSGRTHGLLHSGGRYAVKDQESAIECIEENVILRKIVPEVIEPGPGLFVAIDERDFAYRETFIKGMAECNIPIKEINAQESLKLEPHLNPKLLTSFIVPDGTFCPLRLAMSFAAHAKSNGAKFRLYHEVKEMNIDNSKTVTGVKVLNRISNRLFDIQADLVVSATGAWAGEIASMIGGDVPVKPTPGVMVAFDQRLIMRTINRLNEPEDGDIVLPQRRMSVVGTTSYEISELDYQEINPDHTKLMHERAYDLVPDLHYAKDRGVFVATRPLIGGGTGRSIARTFKCYDHKESDDVEGLVTITGGKGTTMRLMAEKTCDLVCKKLGVEAECRTKDTHLLSYRKYAILPD
jgi:glycerol-3-phosphate dehydrogenase